MQKTEYHTKYEIQVNYDFTDSSSSSSSSSEPEILDLSRFSSELVHRHIIFPLTLLLLEKMIISPDNTL